MSALTSSVSPTSRLTGKRPPSIWGQMASMMTPLGAATTDSARRDMAPPSDVSSPPGLAATAQPPVGGYRNRRAMSAIDPLREPHGASVHSADRRRCHRRGPLVARTAGGAPTADLSGCLAGQSGGD